MLKIGQALTLSHLIYFIEPNHLNKSVLKITTLKLAQ